MDLWGVAEATSPWTPPSPDRKALEVEGSRGLYLVNHTAAQVQMRICNVRAHPDSSVTCEATIWAPGPLSRGITLVLNLTRARFLAEQDLQDLYLTSPWDSIFPASPSRLKKTKLSVTLLLHSSSKCNQGSYCSSQQLMMAAASQGKPLLLGEPQSLSVKTYGFQSLMRCQPLRHPKAALGRGFPAVSMVSGFPQNSVALEGLWRSERLDFSHFSEALAWCSAHLMSSRFTLPIPSFLVTKKIPKAPPKRRAEQR